jgi:hypothetical protein
MATRTCGRARVKKVRTTDYLGNRVTVLHYTIASGMRVREWPDGSMLVEVRAGRFRDFPSTHRVSKAIRDGLALGKIEEAQHRHASGTHEPVTYYRRANGDIGVPPEPGLEPPDDVTVHTFNTLAEADSLSREMQRQMYRDFQDDGVATRAFDEMTGVIDGNPYSREQLIHATMHGPGRKERDVAKLMLEDLDKEERDRQKITTRAFFHYREYDR